MRTTVWLKLKSPPNLILITFRKSLPDWQSAKIKGHSIKDCDTTHKPPDPKRTLKLSNPFTEWEIANSPGSRVRSNAETIAYRNAISAP